MTEQTKKYLYDILAAIALIDEFVAGINDFELYNSDKKTQSAVERQFGIIGEALAQIRKTEPNIIIKNAKEIIGFRNRLVHAYASVDNRIVWAIINRHLKPLQIEVTNMNN